MIYIPLGRHPLGRQPLGRHPPPPRWPLKRAVRILLECILVIIIVIDLEVRFDWKENHSRGIFNEMYVAKTAYGKHRNDRYSNEVITGKTLKRYIVIWLKMRTHEIFWSKIKVAQPFVILSEDLQGLRCSIETRDRIEIITITAVFCSTSCFAHLLHRFPVTDSITSKISHAIHGL